ncbi:AsmA family protein [Fundidesulfovibrio putealis]|uniref:AsmA family protein n=1 Tax=Fundidesulfovibrio putealis TaxID=270496 RepID=UPI000A01FAD4|nr:AsmA family protein [Fundidesulfovibrio putealis]
MNTQTPRSTPSLLSRLPVRRLLAAAVVLVALAYALPPAATRVIGQEVLRAHAQAALSAALDRKVDVSGDVSLTMAPWFGLRTGPVTIPNDPGFGPKPLLSVDSITIGLDLSALITRRILVDSISLAQAELNLGRDETGRENWRIPPPEPGSLPQAPSGWKVETLPTGLRLWNASLSFTDRITGHTVEVRRLNLNTSQSRPFDFSVSCEISVDSLGVAGELHAQGVGSYGSGGGHVHVHSSDAAGWLTLPPMDGMPAQRLDMSAKVMVHGEAGAFELGNLVLDGLGVHLTGQVNAAGLYEAQPYVHLNLAAMGERLGAWARLLGVAPAPPVRRPVSGATPSITLPTTADPVQAELVLSSTPSGWLASKAVLRDGAGRLEGTARNIGGHLSFDVTASGLDISSWVPGRNLLQFDKATGVSSVRGRFTGNSLKLGELDILDMEVSTSGDKGALRLYPFTARSHLALLTSDIRFRPSGAATAFSGTARVQALPPDAAPTAGHTPPVTVLEASLSGEAGARGISGKASAKVADYSRHFKPAWLSEDTLKAWELLGGGSAGASFAVQGGADSSGGAARDLAWEITDLDLKTSASHITGRVSDAGKSGDKPRKTTLDLQADRLELARLRQFAAIFGYQDTDGGFAPWPIDAKIAAKRFVAQNNIAIDDLQAAVQVSPDAIKVSSLSGSTLGGKFTGGADLENAAGRRTLTATLALAGVQSAHLHQFWPDLPKSSGPLECRLGLDATVQNDTPLWQAMRGQAELQLGQGTVTFSPDQGDSRPWPVTRSSASLKFSTKPVPPNPQGQDKPREAVLADVAGTLRVDSPGVVRSSQLEIKGQAGLDGTGKPLWYRQPRVEGAHTLALPFLPAGRSTRASWAGRFEADIERGSFTLAGLELNVGGVPGRASLNGQPVQGATALTGSLDIPEFNPRDAAPRLGLTVPERSDPALWRRARLSAEFGGTLKEVRVNHLQAALDDMTITGLAAVSGPRTRLDLAVNALDLDRLAPAAPQSPNPAKRPETPLPLAELRELSLDAKVRFGRLVKDKLTWENALTEFSAQGGRFQLRQTSPQFYGGPYSLDIRGDARGQEMKAHMELKLSGFSATNLLRDLAGGTSLQQGLTNFYVNVETHGATDRALRRHADGKAGFEVLGGRLSVREAGGRKQSTTPAPGVISNRDDAPPPSPPTDGLPFTRMGADFTVRGGLAITRDFVLAGTGITAKGDGWVNLDDERIDLYLSATVPDVGDIPVRISGNLYDPHMDIDKSKILGDTIVNIFKGVFSIPGDVMNQLRSIF